LASVSNSFTTASLFFASFLVGSFLGVLVKRIPHGEDVMFGRSRCGVCKVQLRCGDLIPLLSWLILRGCCRNCSQPIGLFYPLIEVAALFVAIWSAMVTLNGTVIASCVLGWILLALAVIDWRHFLLPNVLTLPLIVTGLGVVYLLNRGQFSDHLIGSALGYIFVELVAYTYRRLRHREGIGHGDAKLLAAAGAWVGWEGLPSVILIAAVAALLITLAKSFFDKPLSATQRVPFGSYLCLGLWLIWLYGPIVMG
jgi:leader peptidase (prepilin peptidase)/N-methyltransferase